MKQQSLPPPAIPAWPCTSTAGTDVTVLVYDTYAPAVNVSVAAKKKMNELTRETTIENFCKDSCARNTG